MTITERQTKPSSGPLLSIDIALRQIFPSSNEVSFLQNARRIMKTEVDNLSDEDLEVYLTEFQHIIDYYLDKYEAQIFNGHTLKQSIGV